MRRLSALHNGGWQGDLAGGFNTALVALPIELVYGLIAVAPLGLDWAQHGLRAALWSCVLGGVLSAALRTTGGMVNGTASVTALLLGTLAASLMQHPRILASADPAAMAFMLLLLCTALAGAAQWLFGVAGLGRVLKFVPYPVIAGLMGGVAMVLLFTALRPALRQAIGTDWLVALAQWHPLGSMVFAFALALCFWLQRRHPGLPGPALAMLAGTLLHQRCRWAPEPLRWAAHPARSTHCCQTMPCGNSCAIRGRPNCSAGQAF